MAEEKTGQKAESSEDTLVRAVSEGRAFNIDKDGKVRKQGVAVDAILIRNLVHSRVEMDGKTCLPIPFGIVIHHATIDERVILDNVVGPDGGAIAPIEFHRCHLNQGFSGAHGKFSRLSFRNCTFGDPAPPAEGQRLTPTIDLTDAHVDSDLDMEGVAPGPGPAGDGGESKGPYLWIRAVGAKIRGKVELSGCRLRAPVEKAAYPDGEEPVVALNLTLATINGDIRILRAAHLDGGAKLRAVHVDGDVWMPGATVTKVDDDALVLQGARIGGFLMMIGAWDRSGNTGTFHRFRCTGNLKLTSADVGLSLYLDDAVVQGNVTAPDLIVRDDFVLGAAICGDVELSDCEIAGSLYLSGLTVAPSATRFSVESGNIGKSLTLVPGHANYRLIEARRIELRCLPGVELIEGLWRHVEPDRGKGEIVLEKYQLAQCAFLKHGGKVWALDGRSTVFQRVAETVAHKLDAANAEEYLRLYCHWCYRGKGLFRLDRVGPPRPGGDPEARSWIFDVSGIDGDVLTDCSFTVIARKGFVDVVRGEDSREREVVLDAPRFAGGLLLHAPTPGPVQHRIHEGQWVVGPTLDNMNLVRRAPRVAELDSVLRPHVQHRTLFGGRVDLGNLSCDMLDDRAGRAWGGDFVRIEMNHFTYRRASWSGDADDGEKPTHKRFRSWFGRNWVDWVWPTWLHWPRSWKKRAMHWEGWQSRRNWIYHQFAPDPTLPYVFRRKIGESEYRPQPFDQATKVARAEGRESFAINFEILKNRIEWRLFNLRSRWWLGVTAFALSYLWAALHGGGLVWVAIAFFLTVVLMLFLSPIHKALHSALKPQWLHHTAMLGLFVVPAVLLFLVDGWAGRPLHFLIGFLIFLMIRSLSWLADLTLRIGFGYLRRPLRALVTLTVAFLIGWWGVVTARHHKMLVVDVEPVASAVIPGQPLMGSVPDAAAAREIVCNQTLIAPLYALDVLIPLVDLREESRCEIRRLPDGWEAAIRGKSAAEAAEALHALESRATNIRSVGELWEKLPDITVKNHHFWAVLKVLYAIAGWFIVSLALLTFTQVNRTREEVLPEAGRR